METEIGPKFQLHVSGLNMLSKCGIQFERRYIRGEKVPPGISMAVGLAVDASVTADLGSKIATGALLPREQVMDSARDALVREWERVEVSDEDISEEGIAESKDGAIDASVSLADFHHVNAAPMIEPTHVQRPWVLDIEGLPIQLAGTIDIQEGDRWLRDTKTSAKSPNKSTADLSLQLTTYAMAKEKTDGVPVDRVGLNYLVRTKKRHDLKLVQLESQRSREDYGHLLERVYQAHRMIETGVFAPAPTDSWVCSKRFCGYWQTCRFAARPVSIAAPDLTELLSRSIEGKK